MHEWTVIEAWLADLPSQIISAVADADRRKRGPVSAALKAGHLLNRAKAMVPDGEWERWLSEKCAVELSTAQAYMSFCNRVQQLPADEQKRVALLPIMKAIKACGAAAKAPPTAPVRGPTMDDMIFSRASHSIAVIARQLGISPVRREHLTSLREKLAATMAELDRMLEEAQQ